MPLTLLALMVADTGVVPNCVHVPPDGLGDKVILVVNVLVEAFVHANVLSSPALGLAFTVMV